MNHQDTKHRRPVRLRPASATIGGMEENPRLEIVGDPSTRGHFKFGDAPRTSNCEVYIEGGRDHGIILEIFALDWQQDKSSTVTLDKVSAMRLLCDLASILDDRKYLPRRLRKNQPEE